MNTSKQKPELTEEQRAILNTAFDALGANPTDGWFTIEFPAPQITKAVKDGLLNHTPNSKKYRISGKGLWVLGKEHPLKAKREAIEKAMEADGGYTPVQFAEALGVEIITDPPRTEQEQARADLAGDGKQMPEDDEPDIDFGLENKLETAQYDLGLAADTIKDLERQLREAQEELQAERNLRAADQKRIAELEAANKVLTAQSQDRADGAVYLNEQIDTLNQMLAQAQLAIKTLTAERDEARAAALKFTEFASHWRAINALIEEKEATAPIASATIVAEAHRPITFGFLDDHNPAAKP